MIGFYATNIYDQRSKDAELSQRTRSTIATELQTVEKFLPHLASGNEKEKEAAILAVSSLGNTELAAKLATLFGGSGANAALTSIAATSEPGSKTQQLAQNALTNIYKTYQSSIVRVRSLIGDATVYSGTGFIVSHDGFIITAAHLVVNPSGKPENFRVEICTDLEDAKGETAKIVKSDEQLDVALLKMNSTQDMHALPSKTGTVYPGERVSVLGFGSMHALLTVAGEVAAIGGDSERFFLTRTVVPGMSGSPIFGSNGDLVGIVAGVEQAGLTGAIPIQFAKPLLQLAGQN